ncbi:hypothetical protein HPP92_017877 [Vanilla planifolia]|uniref:Uncharacterized protein n=1 Tax=Vanilla planifolia TaxID=51239 RepID=A0A835UMC2_VANPL|nr:hypothetical protein HPP92_017877 [Vanilla planifolia]
MAEKQRQRLEIDGDCDKKEHDMHFLFPFDPGQRGDSRLCFIEDKVDVRFLMNPYEKVDLQAMYYHGSNAGSSKGNYIGKKAELVALNGPLKVDKRNDVSCCVHEERRAFMGSTPSRKLISPELEPMQCSNYADLAVQKSLDGADHNLHCEKVHTTIENKQAQYNSERIETDEHEGSKQVPSLPRDWVAWNTPDKGLGGTGYHVACINGSSSRSSISVCVGTSTYTVRSRFISNHDFEEHELKAWWLGKLRDGGRIPSKEELNDKLQMRIKLGF